MCAAIAFLQFAIGLFLIIFLPEAGAAEAREDDANRLAQPAQLSAKEDHRRLMDLLGIASLRPGASGQNPNLDESKANPFPILPDPLTLKNGDKVTTAEVWWKQRRPEILEDFEREIYGRTPKVTPKVMWAVTNTVHGTNGTIPAIT